MMGRSGAKTRNSRPRILLADASAARRAAIGRGLALGGFKCDVEEVVEGEQALARLRGETFDVCFLALDLPRSDGLHIAETIHLDPAVSARIVIVGNELTECQVRRLRQVEVSGFLKMPYTPEQVWGVLASFVVRIAA